MPRHRQAPLSAAVATADRNRNRLRRGLKSAVDRGGDAVGEVSDGFLDAFGDRLAARLPCHVTFSMKREVCVSIVGRRAGWYASAYMFGRTRAAALTESTGCTFI